LTDEPGTMIEIGGASLWVEEAGAGPAVILIHSGITDARMWGDQWEAFARDTALFATTCADQRLAPVGHDPWHHRGCFPNTAHLPSMECPGEFNTLVSEFLREP
jgi:pimeloyl-ACP methyl ester carboxylesterase